MRVLARKPKAPQPASPAGRLSAGPLQPGSPVPAVVHEVLSSPGEPLEPATRRLMEPRFGHDFGRVRVHADACAARSAEAVEARAYAAGPHLVFGPGEYAPRTPRGRALLAHELTHVVQQRAVGAHAASSLRLGDPSHPAEREAGHLEAQPVLRRAPKKAKTWAGEFVADPYDANYREVGSVVVGYGADIALTFKANALVDAEKIAFVQTALSMKDGTPHNKYDDPKKRKVAESRMIPKGKPGAGTHIDQTLESPTPLYGMTGAKGSDLSSPEPGKYTEIGWHYLDSGQKLQNRDAVLKDEPMLNSGDAYTAAEDVMKSEWSQRFESTALAIAGNQKGVFYGSVEWGWVKGTSDLQPRLLEFKAKSPNAPSAVFMEAARLWNVSVSPDNKPTLDLPTDVPATTSKATVLWDSPDKGKRLATLTQGTLLGRTARTDPKRSWWANVIVIGGPHVGKGGWVMEVDLYSGEKKKP
ncbi:DUF4157 domain-containing protein [Calidithermus chliarophilus]|uniref:eCIS core domain-containing protein n=1 Tax=Calidithermus chliarophilus TaxID=52023 RepID=UPI0012F6418C|nr:DUF4157 domain-containing protein [Calidithermus chliarophilus]